MAGRTALGCFSAWTLTALSPAFAQAYPLPVSIAAGPLPDGLMTLERQTGIELLFDSSLISGHQAPAVHGDLTTEAALRELLAKTDLTVRRAESGAWVVEPPAAAPLARPDAMVPEILVVGQRTENADIRRTENDVQPYTVATKAQIVSAHRDNIDQYFQSRVTANAQVLLPASNPRADTLSEIDLRGLGSEDTLVLIDGRRMPSIPVSGVDFRQADLNAIPLHAIQRIEVLTGAAGGIYGFGALGGVVNVVLDHSTRGLELNVTGGVSSRGDAGRKAVEASFGHTSADGRTDLSVFASYSESDTVLAGQRGFAVRDRELSAQLLGETFLFGQQQGNSIAVFDSSFPTSANLVFKPQFGGARLPSDHTFLPAGFSGSAADLTASLTQHAGQRDFSLAPGDANTDLGSNPRSEAVLVNARHRFGERLEAYVDAVVLRSHGEATVRSSEGAGLMTAASPANPFTDTIEFFYPVSQMATQFSQSVATARYTAGLLTELPFAWRAMADASAGSYRYISAVSARYPSRQVGFLFGGPSDLQMNPLGNWNDFQQWLTTNPNQLSTASTFHNRFRDESLRLAGPVFTTGQGPATLTLLAERRTEDMPVASEYSGSESDGTTTLSPPSLDPSHSTATTSVYAEVRSRLFGARAPALFLRGLELQLAVRHDDQAVEFTNGNDTRERVRFVGTTYTAGAKITPWPWLMLRGSYATGERPPPLEDLSEVQELTSMVPIVADPKRGGTYVGSEVPYSLKSGGYAGLKAVRAGTAFIGTVLTPFGQDGPKLSIDYSRIRKTDDIFIFTSYDMVLAHEDFWPQRVTRAPLTDADRALGYTGGLVTALDLRAMNGASLEVEALDAHVQWPLPLLNGRLRLYADATHQLNNRQQELFEPDVHYDGYLNGPLKWRANGGFDWSRDPLTVGVNVQYFARSLVLQAVPTSLPLDVVNAQAVQYQGARYIPSQTYLDLHLGRRVPLRARCDLAVELGVINVLDKAPPRVSSLITAGGQGYSRYGDPRQRRFELVLSAHF